MLSNWKTDFLKRASSVFEKDNRELDKAKKESEEKIDDLKKLVGQLTYEVDWMKKKGGF
jgi:putative transposase